MYEELKKEYIASKTKGWDKETYVQSILWQNSIEKRISKI